MNDSLGREVVVGDWVVFARRNAQNLIFGQVEAFTPKNVRIRPLDYRSEDGTWKFDDNTITSNGNFLLAEPFDERDIEEA